MNRRPVGGWGVGGYHSTIKPWLSGISLVLLVALVIFILWKLKIIKRTLRACGHCRRTQFTVEGNQSAITRAQAMEMYPPVAGSESPNERLVILGADPEEQPAPS